MLQNVSIPIWPSTSCNNYDLEVAPVEDLVKIPSDRIAKLHEKLKSCGWKIITSPVHVIESLGNKASGQLSSAANSKLTTDPKKIWGAEDVDGSVVKTCWKVNGQMD